MHKPRESSFDVVLIAMFVYRPVADTDTQTVHIGMVLRHWWQTCELGRSCVDVAKALSQLGFPHSEPEIQHSGYGSTGVFEKLEQELPMRSVEVVRIARFENRISGMLLSIPMAIVIAAAPVWFGCRIVL